MDTIETTDLKYADLGYVVGYKHYDIDEPSNKPQVTRNDIKRSIHSYIIRYEREGDDYPVVALLNYDL